MALLVLAFTSVRLPAADPAPPTPRPPVDFSIRHWSGQGGLPLRTVEAILQTRDGFIWFGMNNGLGRFDGASFQVCDPRNTPALGVSYVTALAEDLDGSLWIGSGGGGITRFHHGAFQRFSAAHGLANEQVKALHVSRDGQLWIGTMTRGLFLCRSNQFHHFGSAQGLQADGIMSITPEGSKAL